MRRWFIGVAVAVSGLVLCVSAVAASKTHYTSGQRGKAPYVSVTVSGGQVKTVNWALHAKPAGSCVGTYTGPTHVNTRIKRNGRFNYHNNSIGGGTEFDVHIWGRLNGTTMTVTVDFGSSGVSQSVCEGKHTFHAVDAALLQGRG